MPLNQSSPWPPVASLLPHRGPQLYLDRVVDVEGARIRCETDFLPEQFPGHFPGRPIVPGVVMIEGLAQALVCLAALSGEKGLAVLTGVEKARFRGLAEPPVRLTFDIEVTERRFGVTWAKGKVREGDRVLCTATLQAAFLPADGAPAEVSADAAPPEQP
ncbi:MAG: 3-hydroxyacyl-ACP dehydratase FabZ family protein [Pseudomonadota bacterium]|nr:3-hydroxyacyl-ACP dehydratase FabZ family protein [Pseudomonadota bacterium]